MTTAENIQNILKDALDKEKLAAKNCAELLNELEINGFHDQIEKIRNDEIKHQKIVEELIDLIK